MAKTTTDMHAMAFFNRAREYQKAATQVLGQDPSLTSPIYFLYLHTVELALKAFLRSQNLPVVKTKRHSHKLTELMRSVATWASPSARVIDSRLETS